ncbi:MAG: heme NO-binding domain-containing protein [Candidatus Eisenbacteria sp.]|nr:heme NO-binding domain-containing protein [Candidatus Eisenbacteria bacterium]
MKGVVNKGIEQLVIGKFGPEAWQEVKRRAGCEEPFFATSEDYPDEITLALVKAVSEVSGLSEETVQIEFGKFWVSNTGKDSYPTFYSLAGSSAREFLLNMDRVHEQATRNIPGAQPPRFEYEELPDGKLLMHYHSKRGLCTVFRGLIMGVGCLFGQELQVRSIACVHKGDPHCTIEVTFP